MPTITVPIEDLVFVLAALVGGGLLLVTVVLDDVLGGILDAIHVDFSIGGISLMPPLLAFIAVLDSDLTKVNTALTKLGTGSNALASHAKFVQSLQNSLQTGISNLVDADLAKESAKLQALQVQQQLGAQALSIANQAPQIILSLFRGG